MSTVDEIIIPEQPKMLAKEQYLIYLPKASEDQMGIIKVSSAYLSVKNGSLSVNINELKKAILGASELPDVPDGYESWEEVVIKISELIEESERLFGKAVDSVEMTADSRLQINYANGDSYTTPVLKGEPGAAYVLQDKDKTDIANIVLSELPRAEEAYF